MNYNNGKPMHIEETHKKEMARDFAEGNKSLEKLLLTSWKYGIGTHACCNGHTDETGGIDEHPYINFVVSQKTWLKFASLLLCKFQTDKNVKIDLTYRDLQKFYPDIKKSCPQFNIVLTLYNVKDENLKNSYYNEITWLIRNAKFLLNNSIFSKNFNLIYKKLNKINLFYKLNKLDDIYYSSFLFDGKNISKNKFQVIKHYNCGFQFYKFFKHNEFCIPSTCTNQELCVFLKNHKYIDYNKIDLYKYDITELENEPEEEILEL